MGKTEVCKKCPLFSGIPDDGLAGLLKRMQAYTRVYRKEEILLHSKTIPEAFGIVLSGCVQIMREEFTGSAAMVAQIVPGELFAEAFAAGGAPSLVTAKAAQETEVLWIRYAEMMEAGKTGGQEQAVLMKNMMQILARKNLFLTGRIAHLSRRTLREKVLSYLAEQAQREGRQSFTIPFDRQGLADYLAADRSALSAVLGRLKKEGVLSFRKNRFTLLRSEEEP